MCYLCAFSAALAAHRRHRKASYYESYLDYVDARYDELDALGLDTGRPLDKQTRENGQTWEDYFRIQAEETLPVDPADVERISWVVGHHHTYTNVGGPDEPIPAKFLKKTNKLVVG